jgi:hypothetical protein
VINCCTTHPKETLQPVLLAVDESSTLSGTPQEREIYVRLERRKRLQDTESKKFTQEDKVHSTICRQKFSASQETAGPY